MKNKVIDLNEYRQAKIEMLRFADNFYTPDMEEIIDLNIIDVDNMEDFPF